MPGDLAGSHNGHRHLKGKTMSQAKYFLLIDDEKIDQICDELKQWTEKRHAACRMSRRVGGNRNTVYTSSNIQDEFVSGFKFANESKVDKKQFKRLKGAPDGWCPRADSKYKDEFRSFRSSFPMMLRRIADVDIWRGIGHYIDRENQIIVIAVGDSMQSGTYKPPAHLKRISDITAEKIKNGEITDVGSIEIQG